MTLTTSFPVTHRRTPPRPPHACARFVQRTWWHPMGRAYQLRILCQTRLAQCLTTSRCCCCCCFFIGPSWRRRRRRTLAEALMLKASTWAKYSAAPSRICAGRRSRYCFIGIIAISFTSYFSAWPLQFPGGRMDVVPWLIQSTNNALSMLSFLDTPPGDHF